MNVIQHLKKRPEDFVPLSELNQASEQKTESNQDVEMVPEQLEAELAGIHF